MTQSVIENFGVNIVTSLLTLFVVWVCRKIRKSQILNRRSAFFRIPSKGNSRVFMNDSAYGQNVMTHEAVETLFTILQFIKEINGKIPIYCLDKISEPAGEMTEFCIGRPDLNHRNKVHLENFLKGVKIEPCYPESQDSLALVTKDDIYRFKKDEEEYAILARFYPEPDSNPVILICGQTSRSNQGATHYLVKNYEKFLRKKFGNKKPFCLILKLQSPLTYGFRSVRLVKDVTDIAFVPFGNQ